MKLLLIPFGQPSYKTQVAPALALAAYGAGRYEIALEPALIDLAQNCSTANMPRVEVSSKPKNLVRSICRKLPADQACAIIIHTEAESGLSQNAAYHFAMGELLDELGRNPEAVQEYQRGLAAKPDFGWALFRIGREMELYYHRYDDALQDYIQALKLSPYDKEIENNLIRLQERLPKRQSDPSWRLKDMLVGSWRWAQSRS